MPPSRLLDYLCASCLSTFSLFFVRRLSAMYTFSLCAPPVGYVHILSLCAACWLCIHARFFCALPFACTHSLFFFVHRLSAMYTCSLFLRVAIRLHTFSLLFCAPPLACTHSLSSFLCAACRLKPIRRRRDACALWAQCERASLRRLSRPLWRNAPPGSGYGGYCRHTPARKAPAMAAKAAIRLRRLRYVLAACPRGQPPCAHTRSRRAMALSVPYARQRPRRRSGRRAYFIPTPPPLPPKARNPNTARTKKKCPG